MFIPKRIIFEKNVMKYNTAQNIRAEFNNQSNIEIINLSSNKYTHHIPGDTFYLQYREGKKTLIVGTNKTLKFQSCKPSAHYQLPLVSGCMGQCEYCYLNTRLGDKPFIKVNANIEDILNQADKYISERLNDITIFEGSATSDPVPVEPYTNSLFQAIEFFGTKENARFRFVTKYNDVASLINAKHNGHTEVRFSINTDYVIDTYEHFTASRAKRIEAALMLANAAYPIGFLVAPVFIYEGWKEDYHFLLKNLQEKLPKNLSSPVTFEIISHRYTNTARNVINEVFPDSSLPMKDEERKFKYGQFGYGKYVYPKESLEEIKQFFSNEIESLFIASEIKYII